MYEYLWIVQLVLALALALLLVRQLKNVVLAIIIRLLPRRYRISENSINLHARVSTITSVILVMVITGVGYWSLGKATQLVSVSEQETVVDLAPQPTPNPPELLSIASSITPVPVSEEIVEPPTALESSSTPSAQERTLPPQKRMTSQEVESYNMIRIVANPNYYLQVGAFEHLENAQIKCRQLQRQWNISCRIGVNQAQSSTYKVLLGGFEYRQDAQSFAHKYRIKGFPRATSFFDYLIE